VTTSGELPEETGPAPATPATAADTTVATTPTAATPPAARARRFRRVRRVLGPVGRVASRVPHPPWRSRRGLLLLFVLITGFGASLAIGGVTTIKYTETAAFCGKCHTMDPELKAHAMSVHKELTCAECHVEPGAAGWVKAKIKGSVQLVEIVTGKFPKPIPPPDHASLPSVQDTCLRCHSLEQITANGGPMKLVMRPRYQLDKANTREMVAVLIRPGGLGQAGGARGVHWHIQQKVTYTSADERARKIDLVEIKEANGTTEQFIAGQQVGTSTDVQPDIARLKATQTTRQMDCIDCHNRVGHGVPSPEQAVDESIAAGRIGAGLPFIKRDGVALLEGDYPSLAAADKAITGLRASYAARYPLVLKAHGGQVTAAIDELKTVYRLVATPAMKVQAKTYPDNLGHESSPGCFRCHDGAHYRVVKGRITNQTIPSACATCHTFPQVGATIAQVPVGAQPIDHKDKLYVFDHKNAVSQQDPAGTTCAACHPRSYCQNCHDSGAIKVTHTTMLYKHADAAKAAGGTQACAYCHQPAYCAGCHKEPVLQPSPDQVTPVRPVPLALPPARETISQP
jgi:nitrate/TMAO reductase-like tetraheme cytochrome c subunit